MNVEDRNSSDRRAVFAVALIVFVLLAAIAVGLTGCTFPPTGPSAYTCDDQRHLVDSRIQAGLDLPNIVDLASGERVHVGDQPWHPISHVSGVVPVDANPNTHHCEANQ